MCCNLLEHVSDRVIVRDAILSILKPRGFIIATVSYRFPYHADPIDTMYRPTVKELIRLFPSTSVHKAAIVRASRFTYEMHRDYRALSRMIARARVPFYKPYRWCAAVNRVGKIVAGYKVTCAILRKQS